MKPERWQQVERIFNDALEREPHERASFLDQACAGDSWLRQKIEALIRSDEGAASFLESPPYAGGAAGITPRGQFVGRSLGPYEIEEHLGSGGMGEVYRARDTKLRRDVAIKILPPEFSRDPDRVARFQREAVALAALNHPNIAAIHDLQEIGGTLFLLLELAEGETLAARLKRGSLPVDRAVHVCRQVAEGLEAAHTKGIQHRDLKPHNIQVAADGRVKLLDFGLAKMLAPDAGPNHPSYFTNITQWTTKPGVILGTAPYLSPEQARGQSPDKRCDIWAFGCVLFETLTAKQAFPGETVTDVLAAILKSEPDWTLLPPELPSSVRFLLHRCLQKDPKQRLHEIADVRMALEDALSGASPAVPQTRSRKWNSNSFNIAAVAILAAVIVVAVTWNVRSLDSTRDSRDGLQNSPFTKFLSWTLPESQQLFRTLQRIIAISPDGTNLVYGSNDELYLRPMSGTEAYRIPGTASALNPAFSPDGLWIAFWMRQDRTLKRISVGGGALMTLTGAPVLPSSLSWEGGTIAYAAPGSGILAVSAAGGTPEVWVTAEPGEIADSPQILDGGNAVLFSVTRETGIDRWDKGDIVLFYRKTGERKVLIRGGSDARYVPTGHIVYVLANSLLAVPFDAQRQEITGLPVRILEDVLHTIREVSFWPFGIAQYSFASASNGTLIYVPTNPQITSPPQPNREIRLIVNWFDELRRRVPSS